MFNNAITALLAVIVTLMFFGWLVYEIQQDQIKTLTEEKREIVIKKKVEVSDVEAKTFTKSHGKIKDIVKDNIEGVPNEELNLTSGKHSITFGK